MEEIHGKSLLFVGGGEESYPGIRHAQELGLKTAVLDRSAESPGMTIADRKLVCSIFDIEDAIRLSEGLRRDWPIDGVLSVATDAPKTVAAVAEHLGLPGLSKRSAEIVSNKFLMKERFKENNVPTPSGVLVSSASDTEKAMFALGGKVVVKPVDSRGARGVSICKVGENCSPLYDAALRASKSQMVLVEQFLEGPQFSTESVIHAGRIATVGISTRNYGRLPETYPFPVEDGGDLPARISVALAREIDAALLAAASALNIPKGTIKGDIVIHHGKVYIIELAGRLSGGYFATHEIPLSSGIDYLLAAFRMAMGLQTDWHALVPTKAQAVAQRYFFPKPGEVQSIYVPEWIETNPDVQFLVVRAQVGDQIPEIRNHPSRAGLVIATGENRQEAIAMAESVARHVEIRTVVK